MIENLFLGKKIKKWEKIFCASENFFSAKLYKESCANKSPTLSLIKSKSGRIIGGYSSISWNNYITKNFIPDDSFLFCFDRKLMIPLKSLDCPLGNLNYLESGPVFGQNLFISDFCDKNNSSFCAFGKRSKGETFKKEYFCVEEYEVFSVQIT